MLDNEEFWHDEYIVLQSFGEFVSFFWHRNIWLWSKQQKALKQLEFLKLASNSVLFAITRRGRKDSFINVGEVISLEAIDGNKANVESIVPTETNKCNQRIDDIDGWVHTRL